MNNIKRAIIILIMGIILIPNIVYGVTSNQQATRAMAPVESSAVEKTARKKDTNDEIPTEGVTYFLIYPNGHEVATESYDDAMNPPEMVIYEGDTNDNGEIILENVTSAGQLRIVEDVPAGYTTNQRELLLNLEENSVAQFVNNRGLVNPQTGTSILFIVFIIALATVVALYLKNKVKKVNAAGVVVLIVVLTAVGYRSLNVNAAVVKQAAVAREASLSALTKDLLPRKNLVISVKDNHRKNMSNVRVKVYAKPIKVEESPAIKFSANGGTFFDGTDLMYFRIPNNGCTYAEFEKSLSIESLEYLNKNKMLATKPGYINADFALETKGDYATKRVDLMLAASSESPRLYYNGDVIYMDWVLNEKSAITTYHLNGGTIDFYGKKLSTFKVPVNYIDADKALDPYLSKMIGPGYLVGYSEDEQCGEYAPYGINTQKEDKKAKRMNLYACWNSKPDGIYVNDRLYVGSADNCFGETMYNTNNTRKAFTLKNQIMFFDTNTDTLGVSYLHSDFNLINNIPILDEGEHLESKASNESIRVRQPSSEQEESSDIQKMVDMNNTRYILANSYSMGQKIVDKVERIETIKIVYHGKEILNLTSADMLCNSREAYCLINNGTKNELKDYFNKIANSCIVEPPQDALVDKFR